MQAHQNRRLFDLAQRNSQRMNLESLLATGPTKLWLDAASLIYHPDTPTTVANAVDWASRLHSRSEPEFGIEVYETSSETRAKQWVTEKVSSFPSGQYYIGFGSGVHQFFGVNAVWVPKYPIILTSLPSTIDSLNEILSAAEHFVIAIRSDGGAGAVMDSYGGYLPDEPSSEEVVYELTAWKSDA